MSKNKAVEKSGDVGKATRAGAKHRKQDRSQIDLAELRKPVEEARARLDKAQADAKQLQEKARMLVTETKAAYLRALAPYRHACRRAKARCDFAGGRGSNRSDMVRFVVQKTDKGVRVSIKGRPKTEELIPLATLKESVNKAAYAYTEKHLGSKEKVGNKGGSLSNRLRAILQ